MHRKKNNLPTNLTEWQNISNQLYPQINNIKESTHASNQTEMYIAIPLIKTMNNSYLFCLYSQL